MTLLICPLESYVDVPVGVKAKEPSNNLIQIRRFLQTTNFLDSVLSVVNRSRFTHPLLRTLQLIFTHWQLDASLQSRCCGFSYSQQAVYMHPDKASLFLDRQSREVNIEQLLHIANFFKSHFKADGEHTLLDSFNELKEHQRPGVWDRQLFQGPGVKRLSRKWRGSYGMLCVTERVANWNQNADSNPLQATYLRWMKFLISDPPTSMRAVTSTLWMC